MALTLDATVGGPSANAYATVAEGDAYHEAHVYASVWVEAGPDAQAAALVMATRLLDVHVDWVGQLATQGQALQWPRYVDAPVEGRYLASTIVPTRVKDATAELARQLLVKDRTADLAQAGVSRLKAGPIELEFNAGYTPATIPDAVLASLRAYGRVGGGASIAVPLVRV